MLIIIVGAGAVGYSIAKKLSSENIDVVVVDNDAKALAKVEESLDVGVIHGNGSSPKVLRKAGIQQAEMLVSVTNVDEVNMVASLIGTQNMPLGAVRIARIRDVDYLTEPSLFDRNCISLDLCINPEKLAAENIAHLLSVPSATDVVGFAGGRIQIIGLPVAMSSPLAGVAMRDLGTLYPDQRFLFAAIVRQGGVLIPTGDDLINANDHLLAVMESSRVHEMLKITGHSTKPVKRVVIAGGTAISRYLAMELARHGISTKVINPDEQQCCWLAEHSSDKIIVLHGDSTDECLLEQENIGDADAFVAAGPYDEANVLSALLAKRQGVARTVVVANKTPYIPIIQAVGVDAAISTHQVAVSSILHFIRRGKVIQVSALGSEAEAIEFEAQANSPLVNRPLAEAHFPKGALVAAIMRHERCTHSTNGRGISNGHHPVPFKTGSIHGADHQEKGCLGEIIIPQGSDSVRPKDRVIVFALKEAIPAVEKALSQKIGKRW